MSDEIKIVDLDEKKTPEDSNIMIIEDSEDTKKISLKNIKRSFVADDSDPTDTNFYSAQKIEQLFNGLKLSVGSYPTLAQFNSLKTQVDNMQTSSGSSNSEVVAARGAYSTLSNRLDGEREVSDSLYLSYPRISKNVSSIDMKGYTSTALTLTIPSSTSTRTLSISSRNILMKNTTISSGVSWSGNDLVIKQITGTTRYTININNNLMLKGTPYYLYSTPIFGGTFKDTTSIKISLTYTDGSTTEYPYKYGTIFALVPEKNVTSLSFVFNSSLLVNNSTVTFKNIMISSDPLLDSYVEPYSTTVTIAANSPVIKTYEANEYIYTISDGLMNASYPDNQVTGEMLDSKLDDLNTTINGGYDHCGLLTNQGQYIFFGDGDIVNDTPTACTVATDASTNKRNSKESLKFTMLNYDVNTTPVFTKKITEPLDLGNSKYISIQLYIDKLFFNNFTSSEGIKVYMSSDSVVSTVPTNYYYYKIPRSQFVQGWNTIKIRLDDFSMIGTASWGGINQIHFSIYNTKAVEGMSIWFNSIIIDQTIQPTILFAFENVFTTGFNYQYPLLYNAGIPCTIFFNNKVTHTTEMKNKIATLEYINGWELANFGCNPDKEILTQDDNPREQYLGVRSSKLWLAENYSDNVVSYAAPYGDLRPITVPILKSLGFTIAMTESDGYCSFFSSTDFAVPMQSMDAYNTTVDKIKKRIDYTIETGQVLVLYTNDVTEYGSDIDATKVMFEAIINYIVEKQKTTDLKCMTFRDFYNACIN